MFLKGLWDQHRAQKWNREQLRKSFGKAGRTEYADGELNGIVRYFEKHPKDFQIDDITWNDLNLDEIFLRMNSTCSSAGQEYLYAMLRSPSFEEKELQEREKLLEFLEQEQISRRIHAAASAMAAATVGITEWDDGVVYQMLEKVTVLAGNRIKVTFRNGAEIEQVVDQPKRRKFE